MDWVARLVIHQKDEHNWRLRNMEDHPIDPNWETGTYCKCHEKLRKNMKKGKWVVDVVRISGKKYPCIRSAFKIKSNSDDILHYNGYWFNDGESLEITSDIVPSIKSEMNRTLYGKNLSREEWKNLFRELKSNGFHYYEKGKKPRSITIADWKRMKKSAQKNKSKNHRCNLDKNNSHQHIEFLF